jgi:hypothetical protein
VPGRHHVGAHGPAPAVSDGSPLHPELPVHPELEALSFLLGVWEGEGRGLWSADPAFVYLERTEITAPGPYLAYRQQTTTADGARRLHAEVGYLRPGPDGTVELVLVQPTGLAEVHTGTVGPGRLELRSLSVVAAPRALPVTAVTRTVEVDGDRLRYRVRIAMRDEPLADHLEAVLRRVTAGQ